MKLFLSIGSSLEEILAAAREQPDTVATEEVDDSDSSSVGSEEKVREADVADSSDSEVEEGFSFVKSVDTEVCMYCRRKALFSLVLEQKFFQIR